MSDLTPEVVLKHEHDRKKAGQLHRLLFEAFAWSHTPQGDEYWRQVSENLRDLAGEFADE